MKKIELQTIQKGAILDLFNEEFQKIMLNIDDENTKADAERSITIKMSVKPDKLRRAGEVKVQVSSTFAKIKPAESFMFFDRDESGLLTAYADEPGPELPGINEDSKVKSFPKASNER